MFGSTGNHHKEPKRTKAELEAMMRLEAESHARTCDAIGQALRLTGGSPAAAEALEQAARFIRYFTKD